MKTVAYTALHYGRDYLASAVRSVIDAVDEHHFLYTPVGSHGHRTNVPCPESREELYEIARQAAGNKFHWHEGLWDYEGQQRDSIHQFVPDADVILVVDADEVWSTGLAQSIVAFPAVVAPVNRIRLGMVHYWRSFYRCILHDPALPERVIYPKAIPVSSGTFAITYLPPIHHFGYAQRPEIVQYKQLTHGHKAEWRHDIDWFRERYMANAQRDCHPVGSEYWNPETVDPYALGLPEWMRQHPYANLKLIVDDPDDACPHCGSDRRVVEEYGNFNSYICIECGHEYEYMEADR